MLEEVTKDTKVRVGDLLYTPDNMTAKVIALLTNGEFQYKIDVWALPHYTENHSIDANTVGQCSILGWLDSMLERAPRTYKQIFMDKL